MNLNRWFPCKVHVFALKKYQTLNELLPKSKLWYRKASSDPLQTNICLAKCPSACKLAFHRVPTPPEKPEISWIFQSLLESPGKDLENHNFSESAWFFYNNGCKAFKVYNLTWIKELVTTKVIRLYGFNVQVMISRGWSKLMFL